MLLIEEAGTALEGAEAVVIGRSNLFGKPMAQLLLGANATVTTCHSRTRDLPAVCRRADVLIAAVGRARMVGADWVKPGATVIDVGMNRVDGVLCGDVDFDAVSEVAGAITPVPGGVGPMTIACLLGNTVKAARMQVATLRRLRLADWGVLVGSVGLLVTLFMDWFQPDNTAALAQTPAARFSTRPDGLRSGGSPCCCWGSASRPACCWSFYWRPVWGTGRTSRRASLSSLWRR